MTRWAKEVTPENVWKEYSRPQLKRPERITLNGLWDFANTQKKPTLDRAVEKLDFWKSSLSTLEIIEIKTRQDINMITIIPRNVVCLGLCQTV